MKNPMIEVIDDNITRKNLSDGRKNKMYKKIKKRKEKDMDFELKEVFFVFVIFGSLLMIPFLSDKIEVNKVNQEENIEKIYKTLQVE